MHSMKKNKKGFTLAELLVVVAIIAVLVAISIPIFTSQLRKARVAVNQANARAGEAAAYAAYLEDPSYDMFGDYYFYRYIYTFDKDGTIEKIQANDNYKSKPSGPY